MTVLSELQIQHFRNLDAVQFEPCPSFNFIFGENASGKTSLLEAIYMLSLNRSFRTNNLQYLIQNNAESLSVYTRLLDPKSGRLRKMGVSRNRNKDTSFRIDGESVKKASDLAQLLPAIAIEPASFDLIDGSPRNRRSLLDWLVFHVKHEFLEYSRNYQRVLKQRNILLRSGKIDATLVNQWDKLLIQAAIGIERLRRPILEELNADLSSLLADTQLLSSLDIKLEYKSGWGADHDVERAAVEWYEQKLRASFEADLSRGSTQLGSHRHDIKIRTTAGRANEYLSRGQKKTVILAIYLCAARLLDKILEKKPVFLLDDLPSELDTKHLSWLCEKLDALDAQVFISSVETDFIDQLSMFSNNRAQNFSRFHVKQGAVEKVP